MPNSTPYYSSPSQSQYINVRRRTRRRSKNEEDEEEGWLTIMVRSEVLTKS